MRLASSRSFFAEAVMSTDPRPQRLRIKDADLPKDFLAAIGDVTVAWAYVGNLIEVAIWGMLGLNTRQGTSLTAIFHFQQKLNMCRSVGVRFFEDSAQLQPFKDLCKKIGDVYAERNVIEHSTWQQMHPSMPVSRARVLKNLKIEPAFVTTEEVEKTAQTVIKLVMELNDFMERYIPPPSPNNPQQPQP
jgi:hypothetical protein